MANNQRIKIKRQQQTGAAAVGLKPTVAMLEDGELAINTVDGKLFLKQTPTTGSPVVVEVGADPFPSQTNNAGKFLTTNGSTTEWSTPSVVSAACTDIPYSLAPAGVSIGMVVYHDGTQYQPSQANSVATADVIGIVTSINPGVSVTLTTSGYVDLEGVLPDGTWVPGSTYFVSANVPGVLTDVEPVTSGTISKPVMIAITSTRGFFYNWRGIANEIPSTDIDALLPPQDALTAGKVLTSGVDGNSYWGAGGGGSGAASTISVNQTSHTFTVGTLVRYDGSIGVQRYVKSQADTGANADVVGIVSAVADIDNFTITTGGVVNSLTGLVPGASYFLSDTVAGTYTPVEPSAATAISKPVLMALSATSAIFYNWRGIGMSILSTSPEVASQTGNSGKFLSTNGLATTWVMPVASFNNRTGNVSLSASDISFALGFTPYDGVSNPQNFVTATSAVTSFNSRTGAVSLTANDVTTVGGALSDSPVFTGNPTAPTPASGDNDTSIATTAFVRTAINNYAVGSFNNRTGTVSLTATDVTNVGGALSDSPTFTGTPTAPTTALTDSSTKLATTAFVQGYVQQANRNSQGTKTVSTVAPTGTATPGDVWYVV